jgi:hypothetical protein
MIALRHPSSTAATLAALLPLAEQMTVPRIKARGSSLMHEAPVPMVATELPASAARQSPGTEVSSALLWEGLQVVGGTGFEPVTPAV